VYEEFGDMPVVSISDDQRLPLPQANWAATVYHGMPLDELEPHPKRGQYLAFSVVSLPRSGPTGRSRSRDVPGCRSGSPPRSTTWTASTSRRDRAAPRRRPRELHRRDRAEEKNEFLGRARALPVPDRLVGAVRAGDDRVDGLRHTGHRLPLGSVPEVIAEGVSGFVVDDIESATKAVERLDELDRSAVRADFERRFSAERMAHDYLDVYERLISEYRRSHTVPVPMVDEGAVAGV
jgi:hypothetical protein